MIQFNTKYISIINLNIYQLLINTTKVQWRTYFVFLVPISDHLI